MTKKNILRYGIEISGFVLSAFGGFLKSIAPPQEAGAALSVGLASFATLIVFLFVVAISKGKSQTYRRSLWLRTSAALACIAFVSVFVYIANLNHYTFEYPPSSGEKYIAGMQFTPEGEKYWESLRNVSQVVLKFGLENRNLIWTPESINRAELLLTFNYIVLVITLTGTVFALCEGVLANTSSARGHKSS
jgi:hypothetical protein